MQINPDFNSSAYTIRSYKPGEVEVFKPIPIDVMRKRDNMDGEKFDNILVLKHSFIVTPKMIDQDWGVENPHMLNEAVFRGLMRLKPEVLIVGTGKSIHFPDTTDTLPLLQAGIGVEFMDTAAACRTYNFLVSDGRDVAGAFFMIGDE